MGIIEHFPKNYTPLNQQVELLNAIDKAFKSGKKYVICCAPTGSGKSFLSKTLSNQSNPPSEVFVDLIKTNEAFDQDQFGANVNEELCKAQPSFGASALTITKNLQNQYNLLFPDSDQLKGKTNYICQVDTEYNVEMAPCVFLAKLKEECITKHKCLYYNARVDALTNKFSLFNYSMFMALPDHVKKREYLVCDEASELEDELVKRFSRHINFKVLKRLDYVTTPNLSDYKKFRTWLIGLLTTLESEVAMLKTALNRRKGDVSMADRQRYSLFKNLMMSLKMTLETWDKCEYLIEKDKDGYMLTPLKVDTLSKYIFDHGDKILLMSATIIDADNFAKTLGITNYEYIESKSVFDPKKAPIYVSNKVRLNYKTLKPSLPWVTDQIKQICKTHIKEKGIIHTHTMEITDFIKSKMGNDPRFIFREPGQDNEYIIKLHAESPNNTILVSPSLSFGVDLKDELARFQIIVKAAYLPLGNERIKKLFKIDPTWYLDKMLTNLIQACGRGVRTKDDYCTTYILDGCIYDAILSNKSKLPAYFIDRFV